MVPVLKSDEEGNCEKLVFQLDTGKLRLEEVCNHIRKGRRIFDSNETNYLMKRAFVMAPLAPRKGYELATVAYEAAKAIGEENVLQHSIHCLVSIALQSGFWVQVKTLCQELEAIVDDQNWSLADSLCYLRLATAYHQLNMNDESWSLCDKCLSIFENNNELYGTGQALQLKGHIFREQEALEEALNYYNKAKRFFILNNNHSDACCCDRDIAFIYILQNKFEKAESLLKIAQDTLSKTGLLVETAYTRRVKATLFIEQGRYHDALAILLEARSTYESENIPEGLEGCDRNIANVYRKIGRYDEALETYLQLREVYERQALTINIAKCDMLIGMTYTEKSQYDEALAFYKSAEKICLELGLQTAVARCRANMATIYQLTGLYDLAIEMLLFSRDTFETEDLHVNVAHCNQELGQIYQILNQFDKAKQFLEKASEIFISEDMNFYILTTQVMLANCLHHVGKDKKALQLLQSAKKSFILSKMLIQVALCNLLLGEVFKNVNNYAEALTAYQEARKIFEQANLPINVARCELGMAHVLIKDQSYLEAKKWYVSADFVLDNGFPEWAWQIKYGLAQCYEVEGQDQKALESYGKAVKHITQTRQHLHTEQISGAYFINRSHVYERAILLAARLNQFETVIEIAEQSKARAFLISLYNRKVKFARKSQNNTTVNSLLNKAQKLQQKIDFLQNQIYFREIGRILALNEAGEPPEPDYDIGKNSNQLLLDTIKDHQEIIDRLKRLEPFLMNVLEPPGFSLVKFRKAISTSTKRKWRCLAYYFAGDRLVIMYIDSDNVLGWVRTVPEHYKKQLAICVSSNVQRREHVYSGTISGFTTHSEEEDFGTVLLKRFYELLIPSKALDSFSPEDQLFVIPHEMLHALPYHALKASEVSNICLAQQAVVSYMPSLTTLQLLLGISNSQEKKRLETALLCGVNEFTHRAHPLQYVKEEIDKLKELFGDKCRVLWKQETTKGAITKLSRRGTLNSFDVVHFATHARFDDQSPLQSRILLYDYDLTIPAIIELNLQAKIVSLSACDTALRNIFGGDEMIGLVNALFLAGANTILVSLWQVEDQSTCNFMQKFYQHILAGSPPAVALQYVQKEMIQAGFAAYQWAPFIILGVPM